MRGTRGNIKYVTSLIVLIFPFFCPCIADAAQITLGTATSSADGSLEVAVTVQPAVTDTVAAMQFDLHYDSSQYSFADLIAGAATTDSGKETVFSEPEPGVIRVVVAGVNQNSLTAGTIAPLHFQQADSSTQTTNSSFSLEDVLASDPLGAQEAVDVLGNPENTEEENTDTSSTDATGTSRKSAGSTAAGDPVSTNTGSRNTTTGKKKNTSANDKQNTSSEENLGDAPRMLAGHAAALPENVRQSAARSSSDDASGSSTIPGRTPLSGKESTSGSSSSPEESTHTVTSPTDSPRTHPTDGARIQTAFQKNTPSKISSDNVVTATAAFFATSTRGDCYPILLAIGCLVVLFLLATGVFYARSR